MRLKCLDSRTCSLWAAALVMAASAAGSRADEREENRATRELRLARAQSRVVARAAARAGRATVAVRGIGTPGTKDEQSPGYGAGILVRKDGFVLTAYHVVQNATALLVTLADGSEHPARVHAKDPVTDLALIRILSPQKDLPVAVFGDESDVLVGETVLAIGNPFGMRGTVSKGILSARGRTGVVKDNAAPLLQTDAPLNPGSSGGPLLDLEGNVIGMVNAILTRTGGNQGIGFAVPAKEIRYALPSLFRGKTPARGWVGVRVRRYPGNDLGLKVESVVPKSPAARADLRAGDRILRMRGKDVVDLADLRQLIRTAPVGRTISLVLLRGKDRRRVHLQVEALRIPGS